MPDTMYREVRECDFDSIADVIHETWDFESRIADARIRRCFIRVLLSSTMLTSSWGLVALRDRKVVGFILASVRRVRTRLRAVARINLLIRDALMLLTSNGPDRRGIRDYMAVPRVYRSMKDGRVVPAEITFLAVSKSCRGLGIGKHLVDEAFRYFDSCRVSQVTVFTDSYSNFGFYDRQGFHLLNSREMGPNSQRRGDRKIVFMYGISVSEYAAAGRTAAERVK